MLVQNKMPPTTNVASPRTGRPLAQSSFKDGMMESKLPEEKASNTLAFSVPDTPPHRVKSMLISPQPKAQQPFPTDDEDGRHVICPDALKPWTYLLSIPGKNVRDVLIDAFNVWLDCSPENLTVIKQVVGYLHTGSLIIDDIEDESPTRRGQPAAHVMFGLAPALNAGNYVYFLALEKLLLLQSTECVQVFTNEMLNLHRGQGRDIYWRTKGYVASEDEYAHMVCDKTGGLFRLAIRIMQTLSATAEKRRLEHMPSLDLESRSLSRTSSFIYSISSDYTTLADQLALYFQIRDDLINIASPKFHLMKGFCEDITEGKLSFMALHALRVYQKQGKTKQFDELLKILSAKATDRPTIVRALTLMDDTGSFQYTLEYLRDLVVRIKDSIEKLGANKPLLALISNLDKELEDCHDVRTRVIGNKH